MSRNFKFDLKRYYVSGSGNWEIICIYIYHHCHHYHHGCHSHRCCYYFYNIIFYRYFRSIFIKSKIEPLTMALSEISSSLECFGFLNVMKAKSDAFYHVFCPGIIFSWDYDLLVQRLTPNYSADGSNDCGFCWKFIYGWQGDPERFYLFMKLLVVNS